MPKGLKLSKKKKNHPLDQFPLPNLLLRLDFHDEFSADDLDAL